MTGSSQSLESRVAKLEGQLSQLVATVTEFIGASEIWRNDISKTINKLGESLADKTRPNLGVMASWAGVVIAIIGAVALPMASNSSKESARHDVAIRDLDTKLQREYQLMSDKITQSVENVNSRSAERHLEAVKESDRNWEWIKWQTQAELEELRQRRLKTP